ncbi:uncharacterized protein LOC130636544 isoform X2 [Hydractinia symbiolongicarpus]|uniref:uncharacterized protein LOC130636544 isoform X2 n=1 Tax=Hydractinia symbiolongicarpus TaxID=13093 RepID=UPI0025507418|nr:uncharacterized protein LOC130636544 isoform X2 [Hydractinia symbiolongicarpus]
MNIGIACDYALKLKMHGVLTICLFSTALPVAAIFEKPYRCGHRTLQQISSSLFQVKETICGQRIPSLVWYLDGKLIGNGTAREIEKHKYVFTKTFKDMTACGRNLSYVITSFDGYTATYYATLSFNWTPPVVRFSVNVKENCIFLTWKEPRTGLCAVSYSVTLYGKNDVLVYTHFNLSQVKESFKYCSQLLRTINDIKTVGLQAVYKDNFGKVNRRHVHFEEEHGHVHYVPPTDILVICIMAVLAVVVIAYIASYYVLKKRNAYVNRNIALKNIKEEIPFIDVEDTEQTKEDASM